MLANIILFYKACRRRSQDVLQVDTGGLWYDEVAYFLDGVSLVFVYTLFQCKSKRHIESTSIRSPFNTFQGPKVPMI